MSNTQSTNIPNRYTPGEIGDQITVSGTTYECVGVHTFTHYKGVETTYEWVMLAGSGPDHIDDTEIVTAVNAALAKAKESGEFDGPKGDKGDKGDPGQPGTPGATPQKGVDYYTEADKTEIIQEIYNQVVDGNEVAY